MIVEDLEYFNIAGDLTQIAGGASVTVNATANAAAVGQVTNVRTYTISNVFVASYKFGK
jgi:hypothetical protein